LKTLVWICSLVVLLLIAAVPGVSAEAYLHPETGMVFPDRLAGMERGTVTDFEKEHPGYGVSIGYNAPGITVTIYVYNLGMESLSDSLESPELLEHFGQVVEDVMQAGRMGLYNSLQKTSESVVVFPPRQSGRGALCATFSCVQQGVERNSNLYLLAFRNHFLKVRFTSDRSVQAQAEDTLDRFLAYLAASVAKETAAPSKVL